ncbi:protease II [Bifidobacterium dolichotidis]|uniref:Protease II n=1 Tax=Bifidobacterium dolichotidis TaxID=2306976 RepID=A0A430FRS0_9BIFI|nr:S9 family peptidase [Bifidobacterium dolichotidis]RSX55543.1 protease II [Bifidobacterium dolichotidis]
MSENAANSSQPVAASNPTAATASATASVTPPVAARHPEPRTFHGDTFMDDYAWMRHKDSPEVKEFVAAENAYCDARTAHLKSLRTTLFEEFRSHVQETDMTVPTRMDGYWYFTRTQEGKQYAVQCRLPIHGADDWDAPVIDAQSAPGSLEGEQIVFDMNAEAEGYDFFRLGGLDLSRDGRFMLYGIDTTGAEKYDYRIRDLWQTDATQRDLPDLIPGIAGACLTPDAQWVFYTELDDAMRPYLVKRHKVGTDISNDVEVFRETDERFWCGVGMSFDERRIVIGTGSKTSTEVLTLSVDNPTGEFEVFIPRQQNVEYDASFAYFEQAGEPDENGVREDIPLAIVYHNANNPNFEIDVIDMRKHKPPYTLGEGVRVVEGSPYGCERGDEVEAGASVKPISTPWYAPGNPEILQGARGLGIEGISLHRWYVALSYRESGVPHLAVCTKADAAEDFLAGRPWRFREVVPPTLENDECDDMTATPAMAEISEKLDVTTQRLYSVGAGGNPNYQAPRIRYSFGSYTRPGELHELDVATGRDVLLKRANVLGGFDAHDYAEARAWVSVRDGERVPVSLVWRKGMLKPNSPMFIIGYGAYEISSDPTFSVSRLSLLDRGVLYAVPHVRGGGEMGRAWYEQGRLLNKKHTFEDFVDVTAALEDTGLADASRTVANGGSAGGLLMGAIANMAPERYAGIEADVPFVDALTSILDPSLPLTVTEWDEWGDPLHDAEVYRYMKSYSPYENAPGPEDAVADGTAGKKSARSELVKKYPHMFITTSMNDSRVMVAEPLKWVARLQAAGVDAIMKIEVVAGHGGKSGRYKQWEEVCFENAWCLDAMGITK